VLILLTAAALTVVSTATSSTSPSAWACAYVAERLPRSLTLLGEDTVSALETREARQKLGLAEAVLTRGSNLALARSLGATRLIVVHCGEQGSNATIEAQSFDTNSPRSDEPLRMTHALPDLPAAVDQLAQRLSPGPHSALSGFKPPSVKALAKAGPALLLKDANARATELMAIAREDASVDLRLSAVQALVVARDFDNAARLADLPLATDAPPRLARELRFLSAVALLESGRYEDARSVLETLRLQLETAAVLNNLGVSLFRLREPAASGVFERATFLPDHRKRDIGFNRALTTLFLGAPETALPLIDDVLAQAPSDPRARLLRLWALALLNRLSERGEEWNRLMAIAPSFSALGTPDVARRLERIFHSERTPSN
jgi:tetratricopeptide (TPR) repeat protein